MDKIFCLSEFSQKEDESKVSELNEALFDLGILFELRHNEYGSYLIIECDIMKLKKIKTRYAGRTQKSTAGLHKIEDVLKMKETMPEKEILNVLEISRSTYYRRLRKVKTMDNSDFF